MFGDSAFDDRTDAPFLMRALLITQDASLASGWKRVLDQQSFDTVVVADGVVASHLSSQFGVDLIIVAGELGAVSGAEFLSLVRRGLFGSSPPPVIIQRLDASDSVLAEEHAPFGCVLLEDIGDDAIAIAIEQALTPRP